MELEKKLFDKLLGTCNQINVSTGSQGLRNFFKISKLEFQNKTITGLA